VTGDRLNLAILGKFADPRTEHDSACQCHPSTD
jgi:hypothetical protein